jgi:hypothetical protein
MSAFTTIENNPGSDALAVGAAMTLQHRAE